MAKKIQLGLIGYGYWGPNLARVINESINCNLKYCADLNKQVLKQVKQKYPTTKTTTNYKDILKDKDVKAVLVATPTKTHHKIAKDCLLAKKDTFIEKPLTADTSQAQELVELSNKSGLKLMIGHVFLYNCAVRYIKKIINKGSIGKVRHIHFQRRSLGPIRKDINVVWDLAPHDISMVLYFINRKPESVIASGASFLRKKLHDVVCACIKFEDNIMTNFIFSWIDPIKIRDITIVGDKKMIFFDDVGSNEKIRIYDRNARIIETTRDVTFGEYQISLHAGDVHIPSIKYKEPLKAELEHFIDCIIKDKKPLTDGKAGLDVVRIISAIQKSLNNQSKLVKFDNF